MSLNTATLIFKQGCIEGTTNYYYRDYRRDFIEKARYSLFFLILILKTATERSYMIPN